MGLAVMPACDSISYPRFREGPSPGSDHDFVDTSSSFMAYLREILAVLESNGILIPLNIIR